MQSLRLADGRLTPCERETGNVFVICASSEEDRRDAFEGLDFKKYDLESSLDPDEISRIEFEEDLTVLIVKRPKKAAVRDSIRFEVGSVGIFLEPDRVTFVTSEGHVDFGPKPFWKGATLLDVVLRFLSVTVHHFLQHLKAIKLITTEVQSKINSSMENKYLLQMFALVESLIYYTTSIESNESVFAKMKNSPSRLALTDSQAEYLADILIENRQGAKQSAIYSGVLSGLMDARGNIINNNMNVLLKKLTLINVVFLPLNLLAGIGGMSEFTMMTSGLPWWVSYPAFLAAMAALASLCWIFIPRLFNDST